MTSENNQDRKDHWGVHTWFKKFTSKDVVTKIYKDEIHHLVEEATNAAPASKSWLLVYASTLSKFMKNMMAEQTQAVEEMVNEWNENGPDEDFKQEYEDFHSHVFIMPNFVQMTQNHCQTSHPNH